MSRYFLFTALVGLLIGGSARGQISSDPAQVLVDRLDLDKYKATIRGLTQFGDRQAGTARNRAAIDWIEAQLRSYGCPTERMSYMSPLPIQQRRAGGAVDESVRGTGIPPAPNRDPEAQPSLRLRELNSERAPNGTREQVYCTKVGAVRPQEMYIIGAHMDGLGYGEAANDDASGTALVMELARILSGSDVQAERSIRFILFNNEETAGGKGSEAYVAQREALQGIENPPGSGKYPEPRWLGMIQHDMMLFDHGRPRADGTVSLEQRPEADVNIEFYDHPVFSPFAAEARELARVFQRANERYAKDYPAAVGNRMGYTDSATFVMAVPAISLRENERISQIGAGWNPHWHQASDLFTTYSDKDFRLGLNAAQTTMGAVAELARVTMKR